MTHFKHFFLQSICLIGALFLIIPASAQSNEQEFDWVKSINNGNTYNNVRVGSTVDKDGYIYVTGVAYQNLYYDINNLLFNRIGWYDAFVMKIDRTGQLIWTKQLGYENSKSQARGIGLSVDKDGNVYVAGYFNGTIDFNPDPNAVETATSVGGWDGFVCKLDANGNFAWVRTWGSSTATGRNSEFADYVHVTPAGEVFVTGNFQDSLNLNPGTGIDMAYSTVPGKNERFICKLDASGNYLWGRHFQDGILFSDDRINSLGLAVDTAGFAYLAGTYRDGIAFPSGSGMSAIAPIGTYDMYIIKIDGSGNFIWAKGFGGSGTDAISDIAADDKNNLYISGYFSSTADLDPNRGGKTFRTTGPTSYYDAFVLKINTNGDFIWANTFGSETHDNALGIAVDRLGNVYTTGSFQDSVSFVAGSSRPEDYIKARNGRNIFVVKYDALGNYTWSKSFGGNAVTPPGGNGPDAADCINVDDFGNIYVTGYFRDTADFNPGGLPKAELDAQDGNMFLLKYAHVCADSIFTAVEASSCDEYFFDGKTYDSSGIYTRIFPSTAGCDSIVELNLTIHTIPLPVIRVNNFTLSTAQPYSTYQWLLNGNSISGAINSDYTVQENGDYQVAVTNDEGCVDTSDIYKVENYTGIEDFTPFAEQIIVHPNPTTGVIYITSPIEMKVTISSLDGKILLNELNPEYISLNNMASGIYFLRISDRTGQLIKVEKIIKTTLRH